MYSMEFVVYRRREKGRPRNGSTLSGPTARGSLQLRDERVEDFNRLCRVARLVDNSNQVLSDPPPLYDATLLSAKSDLWAIGGYELVDTNGIMCAHAQLWYLIPGDMFDLEAQETAIKARFATQRTLTEPKSRRST
jgi:hypothetical protein